MSGSITLRVLAPDKNVFDGTAEEVILPSTTGQIGILPGHISLLTAIDVGVLRVRADGGWNSIALMGGFAEVDSDEVTFLVNNAELGSSIDGAAAETEFQAASTAVAGMEGQPASPEKVKAQQQMNMARARMQASKTAD